MEGDGRFCEDGNVCCLSSPRDEKGADRLLSESCMRDTYNVSNKKAD